LSELLYLTSTVYGKGQPFVVNDPVQEMMEKLKDVKSLETVTMRKGPEEFSGAVSSWMA
jgi:hypothetical protein